MRLSGRVPLPLRHRHTANACLLPPIIKFYDLPQQAAFFHIAPAISYGCMHINITGRVLMTGRKRPQRGQYAFLRDEGANGHNRKSAKCVG